MATATKKKKKAEKTSRLQPLGDRLVVKRNEQEEVTAGGIVLPGAAQTAPTRGIVVSVGDGRLLPDGTRSPLQVAEGDHIIFSNYAGSDSFKINDEEMILLREDDVLAVLQD